MIPGVSDTYIQSWYILEDEAPANVELVVYEWPGLGFRRKDQFLPNLDDMAADCFAALTDVLKGGPFILAAHSLGTRIMVRVAERAKRELAVEPLAVLALDCGAPHLAVFSEYGLKMLSTQAGEWQRVWNFGLKEAGGSKQTFEGIWSGFSFANETMPIGFHHFTCPLTVMVAKLNCTPEVVFKSRTPEDIEEIKKYTRTGCGFFAHYPDAYTAWDAWADDLTILEVDCGHTALRSHEEFKARLWKTIDDIITGASGR